MEIEKQACIESAQEYLYKVLYTNISDEDKAVIDKVIRELDTIKYNK